MTANYFLQLLVNGVVTGCGYALVAVGWTIMLGTARLANFAHGTMYMVGAFVVWYVMTAAGMPYFVAILVSILVLSVIGYVVQLSVKDLIRRQDLTSIMILTLGISYMLTGAASLFFSGQPQNISSPLRPIRYNIEGIRFTLQDAAIVVVSILVYIAVWLVKNKTKLGSTIRALAEDSKLTQLYGINPNSLLIGIFVFEGATIALAAGLIAPRAPIFTSMGFQEVIFTFVIVVLGGIGSVSGAFLAGLGMGVFMAFFGALVSSAYALAAVFSVMLMVLLLRPSELSRTH
jgi:branched-chain amino acid transport system permease protein